MSEVSSRLHKYHVDTIILCKPQLLEVVPYGLEAGHWSWALRRVPLDRESASLFDIYCCRQGIFVLLTITSFDVMHFIFTNAYKTRIPLNIETSPMVWKVFV